MHKSKPYRYKSDWLFLLSVCVFINILVSVTCTYTYGQSTKSDSLKILLNSSTDTTRVNIMIQLSNWYRNSNTDTSEIYAKQAYALASETNYKRGIARGKQELGRIEILKGNFPKALELTYETLKMQETLHDNLQIGYAHVDLGSIYGSMSEYKDALDHFNQSIVYFEKVNAQEGEADAINNIGIIYDMQGNLDSALIFYNRSLDFYKLNNAKQKYANTMLNIGGVYGLQGNHRKAIENIEKSCQTFIEMNDYNGITAALNNLAENYKDMGNYKKSIDLAAQSLALSQKYELKYTESKALFFLAICYDSLQLYKQALYYQKLYSQLNETLYNEDNARLMNEMEAKYESEKKEKKLHCSKILITME